MLCVGLTGSIASGKTLAAHFFEECGAYVINADAVSRAVVVPGQEGWKRVVEYFGPKIIHDDGTLDRARLGSAVFSDREQREVLNKLLHQLILERIKKDIDAMSSTRPSAIVIVELPLLIECGLQNDFDCIIVVSTSKELQRKRLVERNGLTEEEAIKRIQAQFDTQAKEAYADYIISNSGSIESLKDQVCHIYAQLQQGLTDGAGRNKM
jgi:dephospho-CoA kinase